ncbi:MAG: hypothetical protein LWW87_12900 [Geobacteraceae bacterium]|nr:hypothetical protein [Geobacteraceae bacterium]
MKLSDFLRRSVRQIQYYPALRPLLGSATATIFFGQALYWSDKTEAGWFWKTQDDWQVETGLTPDEQSSARKKLKKIGVLKEEFRGIPRKLWFSLDLDRFEQLVEANFSNDINIIPNRRFIASDKAVLLLPTLPESIKPKSRTVKRYLINTSSKLQPPKNTNYNTRLQHKITTTPPTTSVVDVDQNDLLQKAKVLLVAWPEAAAAAPSVAAALANHPPEFIAAQIEHSRKNARTNPCAYLQGTLEHDWAGFYATAEAKAAAAAAKQVKVAQEAARQAEEDAKLPPVTARECFSIIEQLETAT